VHRQPVEVDLADERLVWMPRRNPGQKIVTRHGAAPESE
jgi:hypothetical protein